MFINTKQDLVCKRGYVLINPRWAGFKAEDYHEAALSVSDEEIQKIPSLLPVTVEAESGEFDLRGYEIVRAQFFEVKERITVTFTDDQVIFNKAAILRMSPAQKRSYLRLYGSHHIEFGYISLLHASMTILLQPNSAWF